MRRLTFLLLAVLATAAATARPALAVMEPARAQADVDAAMREHDYPFCREPHEPLSSRAVDLCDHASAIPGCSGYVAACATATAPHPPPSTPWWLRWLTIPPFIGTLAQGIVWLLVAALVIAVVVPIARGLARMRRKEALPAEKKAPGVITPEPLMVEVASLTDEEQILARARELAMQGELAASMQLYLVASLRALDKRGAVRIAKDRTNGEYVRACTDPGAKPALRDIVREVDRVQFGGEAATPEGLERAARQAIAIVRTVPVMMLLVMVSLSLGCGGVSMPKPRLKGDDPAGYELMRDVVTRQGVNLHGLGSSLATMPLPAPGERAPAVLVDLESTALDDETREHLMSWVDAGGVLVLAGGPWSWPKELKGSHAVAKRPLQITVRRLLLRAPSPASGDTADGDAGEAGDDADEQAEGDIYAHTDEHGELVETDGITLGGAIDRVAWFTDGTLYAASVKRGHGVIVGIANDELFTNAGLARPGNAAALVAILASASRTEMRLASAEDGVSPPSTPIAALLRAGLGLALAHAAVFALVLFVAVGRRQARPRPMHPPRRRAFSEHVEAVGALYGRARSAPHALAAYARFADERLRARMPRGSGDVASFLASRARMPLHVCQQLWARAMQAKSGAPPLGDELTVLRELSSLYAAAMAQDR
jgi:hypothetical protein